MGFYMAASFVSALVGAVILLMAVFVVSYIKELITKDDRPQVAGPIFNQLIHLNRLYDYLTSLARKYTTCRFITPSHSEVYTADPVNVEYILKTNFSNYGKGVYNIGIMSDLFGDGDKWRHQRKLASHEFSTKVLRDFSTAVFRTNAAKLASKISEASMAREMMDLQGGKEDILSRFLIEIETNPETMSDKYLRDITLSFIIAGKDTSANALTRFFYMLCKNPLVQEKAAQEMSEATEAENTSISSDKFVDKLSEAALDKMQYLHAAITETLRLYPAVPVDGKSSDKDDVLPDGFKIKRGDGMNYMAYAMGRMAYIWGQDAEEFVP